MVATKQLYTVSQKNCVTLVFTVTLENFGRFKNVFTVAIRNYFYIKLWLKLPLHLNFTDALPCKMQLQAILQKHL